MLKGRIREQWGGGPDIAFPLSRSLEDLSRFPLIDISEKPRSGKLKMGYGGIWEDTEL